MPAKRFFRKYGAAAAALIILLAVMTVLPGFTAGTTSGTTDTYETEISPSGTELEVFCFQAGKADALLLTTEDHTVLIDCGVKGFGQTILDELAARGIDYIDYLIITHFDQDHVGGAAKVINNIGIGTVLQSNCPKDSTEYGKYIKALNTAGIEAVTVQEVYEFVLDGAVFSVDPPRRTDYNADDSNNSSLIVTVYNGENVLLFMGDAQTERLEEYLEDSPTDCDFLKVPHHGGEDALTDDLIAAVSPEYAVITSSDEEPEAESTTDALEKAGAGIYLTRIAPVVVRCDGTTITADYCG